ncbi:hypothetical protein B0T16DRAFT_398043 [Cercophora newfieldiana]|uniref:Uncharacterized protein n=1 Tax=Cercophora newfieldiana TaxID=92897 RepID=A0AA39YNP4_9PEZI|nr:hypothetical protein B0T16DRAFT_398043 [Cercophora newfieldiana]
MLLTSGQVSVAVSSGVVFVFTAALFFSGYAIQQRTLRDLRIAIKPSPRPSPKIFLPDRFQKSTTELEDGTIVAVDDDEYDRKRKPVIVEVRPTLPEDVDDTPPLVQQQQQYEISGDEVPTQTEKEKPEAEENEQAKSPPDEAKNEKPQKPISRAERRRRIKEEIQKLAQGEERGYYQRRLW